MANLLATLLSLAHALSTYDKVLTVSQSNIANASTSGWAKQTLSLTALQMELESGSTGGVNTLPIQSSRNEYAVQAVPSQNSGLGQQQQAADCLGSLQNLFDI